MGNKQSIPAPELVYRAAKAGSYNELKALAQQIHTLGADAEPRRRELLEWCDERGRTALIVAAGRGHKDCVELLLQSGANVQHQSMSREGGGSALHVAVFKQCTKDIIDNLLRYGASPFVENAGGFTALDYAVLRKNSSLVRRLESFGYFADYLSVKTTAFLGLNKRWAARWVAIVPRHPDPRLPANQQMIRRVLLIYSDAQQCDPSSKMYLDGSKAVVLRPEDHSEANLCVLKLHSTHPPPKGNLCLGGDGRTGVELYLKPTSRDVNIVHQFVRVVNQPAGGRFPHPAPTPQSQLPPLVPNSSLPPSGNQKSDAEIAAELSRVLNGGASVIGTSTGGAFPTIVAPGLDRRNTAPPETPEESNAAEAPHEVAPSAPPMLPTAPPMVDSDAFISSEPSSGTNGGFLVGPNNDWATSHPYHTGSFGGKMADLGEEDLCVICLSEKKEAGFVHGKSVHKCCCVDCAKDVMKSGEKRCPICRQEIEHLIEHFYS
ncbi:hypothetical protein BSKO_05700 [Bryopsis sp. KO-2023]|nr:hypothetical protein BSKO_05700 [Bryopsis sp. KO-2023]